MNLFLEKEERNKNIFSVAFFFTPMAHYMKLWVISVCLSS